MGPWKGPPHSGTGHASRPPRAWRRVGQDHLTGEAFAALVGNGVDERKNIIGASAPTPYLFNIPMEHIERFRAQVELVNLMDQFDPELNRKAVWSCFQESPIDFREYSLFDPGAYPQPSIDTKITWRVTKPWAELKDEEDRPDRRRGVPDRGRCWGPPQDPRVPKIAPPSRPSPRPAI